jgi:hypothetical protein
MSLSTGEVAEELGEGWISVYSWRLHGSGGAARCRQPPGWCKSPAGPRGRGLRSERDVSSGGDGGNAYGDASYLSSDSFRFGEKVGTRHVFAARARSASIWSIRLRGLSLVL